MPRFLALILLAAFSLLVSSCSSNSQITNVENQPPLITALSVTPEQALAGVLVSVSSEAYDPEGEDLSYDWSSTFGYFSGTGAKVTYHTEGCCLGQNEITLTVTDPQRKSAQRKIWVIINK